MGLLLDVDRLLRGHHTGPDALAAPRLPISAGRLLGAALAFGAVYGAFMGLFAVLTPGGPGFAQLVSTMLKVPLLFLLTLAVTFPSLYVFSALARSSLGAARTLELLLVAITVSLAILASLGPVTGFFTLSTDSYPFMKLLNVAFFAIAGLGGILFLRVALRGAFAVPAGDGESAPGGLRGPRAVLRAWIVIYAMVGAQMGWVLRPFVGAPQLPFRVFRAREANVFVDVLRTLGDLFR
jgi:hypothetical protein